ncbi:MAG: hypothetical protein ACE5J2_08360 [Nitrososphaerales archaeon]
MKVYSVHVGLIYFVNDTSVMGGMLGIVILLSLMLMSGSIVSAYAGGTRQYLSLDDSNAPSIRSHYHKPDFPTAGSEIKLYAKIIDDVSVERATLFYLIGLDGDPKDAYSIEMSKYNTEWFTANIPSKDVTDSGLKYWIVAEDPYDNSVTGNVEKIVTKPSLKKSSFTITPPENMKLVQVIATTNGDELTASIAIINLDERKLENLRIMLSSELRGSFRLSDNTISSIDPRESQTVDLKHIGKPNVDVMGNPVGYRGQIIIAGENMSPITLDVTAAPVGTMYDNSNANSITAHIDGFASYMNGVVQKAEERYRSPLSGIFKSLLLEPRPNYEIASDGSRVIEDPASTLTIRNMGDEPLKNVRIDIRSLGKQFLLEEKNIDFIGPDQEISISLISKMESDSGSRLPYRGELVIVPDYGVPMTVPIDIAPTPAKTDPFEVSTMNGGNGLYTVSDKMVIKNTGGRSVDSVRIMLPMVLAKSLMLSDEAFKKIDPGEERTVDIKLRGGISAMMEDIAGDLIVVSEHHGAKSIPVDLSWKEFDGKYFSVYARDNAKDLSLAQNLVILLDRSYKKIAEGVGETKIKSTIYIISTSDEMRNLIGSDARSFYDYTNDVILVCGCSDDIIFDALYEHTYSAIIDNNPSYMNREKILFDRGNWLVDGLARYIVAGAIGENWLKKDVDAYNSNPVELEWYGPGTHSHNGASYTFVKYLSEEYGGQVIEETLGYLGGGQISNHRCDTLENCSVLRAVYTVSGLDIDNKRYPLNFDMIMQGWQEYMQINYESPSNVNLKSGSMPVQTGLIPI